MKSGDHVKIVTRDDSYEGVLMPEEEGFYVVKLENGYNIGVDKKRVKNLVLLGEKQLAKSSESKKLEQKKDLPKISILHTGGTIASKVDYETGGVISRFTPEELIDMFPEIKNIAQLSSRLVRNMWSEDIRLVHYNILAKEVEKEIKSGATGVIITHGTDTLHCTSAALSFALQNLPVPVIVVGSQRSSDRPSSDAAMNLICAATFIANTDLAEVVICMHENTDDNTCVILQGTKCRKMHSSRRDAFKPINSLPFAKISFESRKIDFLRTDYKKKSSSKLKLMLFDEKLKIGLLKTHINMFASEFDAYKDFDGLILEGTGMAGNPPINEIDEFTKEHTKISKSIKKLVDKGVIVAAATQTIYGSINMNVYTTGRKMQELGIIGNYHDMHPETAFIKLAWLLSNFKKKEIKELFSKNLVGEISERLEN